MSEFVKEVSTQDYVVCDAAKRLMLLNSFLRKNVDKKVIVFCSSDSIINFLTELFRHFKIPVVALCQENVRKADQEQIVQRFCEATEMVLLCTNASDISLSRLTPHWMVQYDPPKDFNEYVKRSNELSASMRKLLFLQPDELGFLTHMKEKGFALNEYEVKWSKVSNIQSEIQKLTSKEYAIHMSAVAAYKAYVKYYASHPMEAVFNVNSLDLEKTGKSFGLRAIPFVDFELARSKSLKRANDEGTDEIPVKKAKVVKKKVLKSLKSDKTVFVR